MKQTPNLLKQKVAVLTKKIKEKDQLLKKYQKGLEDSNRRVTKIAKKLEDSLSLIRDINQSLVPTQLPAISGFEFSHKFVPAKNGVSGDFFNIIPIKNSMKFGIVLSSCNTYSLSSLFLSSFLKSSLNIPKYKTAKDFVSVIAKKMKLNGSQEIHLFYGIVSRSSFEMDYCLVGDIFAGRKKEKGAFNIFKPCADNLWQTKAAPPFQSGKLILEPKDTLLICSPGIKHRENKKGSLFGAKNIIKAVEKNPSAEVLELRQNVLFACNEFGKNKINQRDCTILAIKVLDTVLRLQPSL